MICIAKLAIIRRLTKASVAYNFRLCSITYIKGKDKPPPRRATAHLKSKLRNRIELQFIFKTEVIEGLEIFAHSFLLASACRHRRYRVAACLGLRIGGEERIDLTHAQPHHQTKHDIGTGHLL